MRRVFSLSLITAAVATCGLLPAQAQLATDELKPTLAEAPAASTDATKTDASAAAPADSTAAPTAKPVATGTTKSGAAISGQAATRAASTVVGSFFGTPIAIARHSVHEINVGAHDLIGESNNKFLYALGLPLATPYGIISGVLQGPFWGCYNAYKGSKDQPFNQQTFSLDEIK